MILQTHEDYQKLKSWLEAQDEVSFDIETTGTEPDTDLCVGLGFSKGMDGFYMPLYDYDASADCCIPTIFKPLETEIIAILATKRIMAWNGGFEASFYPSMRYSLHIDGMILRHTVNENLYSYALKDNAQKEFGDKAIQSYATILAYLKTIKAESFHYYKAPRDMVGRYCIDDCKLTERLIRLDWKQLQADGLVNFFLHEQAMPLYKHVTMTMEQEGIALDMPLLLKAQQEIKHDIKQVEQSIHKAIEPHLGLWKSWLLNKDYPPSRTGPFAQAYIALNKICLPRTKAGSFSLAAAAVAALPESHYKSVLRQEVYMTKEEVEAVQQYMYEQDGSPAFNFSSPHHIKKLFFDTLKEKPLSKTKAGAAQADEDFLLEMSKKYEWCKDLLLLRKLNKLDGTYISRLVELQQGGKFYPRWNQVATVTHRYGGDFQQLPRPLEDDASGTMHPLQLKYTNLIRNFFIAEPGRVLIDADYESLEPHVFAHISKDPALIEIFKQGHDFYSTVAIKTEKLQGYSADKKAPNYLGKLNKPKRQSAKPYVLGIAYGEEAYKLSFELGIELEAADKLVKGYWAGFPVLKQTSDAGKKQITTHGWITSELGPRRRLHEARDIYSRYGTSILDSLELWKQYNTMPKQYEWMKLQRSRLKKALNAAINFPTQATATCVVNRSAVAYEIARKAEGLDAPIIAQIHDELLLSAKKEHAERAAQLLKKAMTETVKLSVPLKAEPCIGTRYGEIK